MRTRVLRSLPVPLLAIAVALAPSAARADALPPPVADDAMPPLRSPRVGLSLGGVLLAVPSGDNAGITFAALGHGRLGHQFNPQWGLMADLFGFVNTQYLVGGHVMAQWNAPRYFFIGFGGGVGVRQGGEILGSGMARLGAEFQLIRRRSPDDVEEVGPSHQRENAISVALEAQFLGNTTGLLVAPGLSVGFEVY